VSTQTPRCEPGDSTNQGRSPISSAPDSSQVAISTADKFNNIPHELREYTQWLCWRLKDRDGAKPTKLPINARTGELSSVTKPTDWSSYEEAVAAVATWGCSGIGFVLTRNDPYAFIDLDHTLGDEVAHARQIKIFESFDSYSELSPSGNGLHIIIRANLLSGKRRGHIELYPCERFMTMTGDVYHDAPIRERQELADILWAELGGSTQSNSHATETQHEPDCDAVIIQRASNAANGAKFRSLFNGDWHADYLSQSQADLALINLLAFYSKSHAQIARIFLRSGLGQRNKAKRRDYIGAMITKARDREIPETEGVVDFSARFKSHFTDDFISKAELKSNVFSFSEFTKELRPPFYIWHRVFRKAISIR
jgi:primase-polymerase (primpol)-like protein